MPGERSGSPILPGMVGYSGPVRRGSRERPWGYPGRVWQTGTGAPQKSAKDFNEFKSSLMSIDEFKKVSKGVPLAKRPQKWWDLLSILGGIVAAILWFLYRRHPERS